MPKNQYCNWDSQRLVLITCSEWVLGLSLGLSKLGSDSRPMLCHTSYTFSFDLVSLDVNPILLCPKSIHPHMGFRKMIVELGGMLGIMTIIGALGA